MAPRRGAETTTSDPEPQIELARLAFNQSLSWRAGQHSIAAGELIRRLERLGLELQDMDQDETDKSSLANVAKDLVTPNLLGHKDKGVRAWTARCLVDVLKICAPDAPFTGTQLRDVFTLFVQSILPSISDPSNTYNREHRYVIESLAEVKSIILLTDLPQSEELLAHFFTTVFDIISTSSNSTADEQISKDTKYHLSSMLVTLVDEAPTLPPEVIDTVMAQFLRASISGGKKGAVDDKQSTLLPKELPEAYTLAKTLCNSCPEKMARYISQYFNDVMVESSAGSNGTSKPNGHRRKSDAIESDEEDASKGPTDADLRELNKAHQLLRELWRTSPAVLQNVIPQVEAELSAENGRLRTLATETLGDMISGIGAAGLPPPPEMDPAAYPPIRLDELSSSPPSSSVLTDPISLKSFAETHFSAYQSFVSRQIDKSPAIRAIWATAVGRILITSAGGIGLRDTDQTALIKGLATMLVDGDEKVRLAAIRAVANFGLAGVMAILVPNGDLEKPNTVLGNLAERCRDVRPAVRGEAMIVLGRLWGVASGEITDGNESVKSALGGIPSKIMATFYANDPSLNAMIDEVMYKQLLPLNYPPVKKSKSSKKRGNSEADDDAPIDADKVRTERLLLLVQSLDLRAKTAFFAMQSRRPKYTTFLEAFLRCSEECNGGEGKGNTKASKAKLDTAIKYVLPHYQDQVKASMDLHKFAKHNNRRTYSLLRWSINPTKDFRTVYNSMKEVAKILDNDKKNVVNGVSETIWTIMFRSAYLVYNRSHLPHIIQFARNDSKGLGATAHEVLNEISEKSPESFQATIKELCSTFVEQAPSESKSNDVGSVESLKACANFIRRGERKLPKDPNLVSALQAFAKYGTPPKAAKYAISVLMAASDKKELHVQELLEASINEWRYGEQYFLTKLAQVGQLVLLQPEMANDFYDAFLDIAINQVLRQVRTVVEDEDGESRWIPDSELDNECKAKCLSIKILVNHLRAIEDAETAKTAATPIYKLLNTLISQKGEVSKQMKTPKAHRSRLLLFAAQSMLKLCTRGVFDKLFSHADFEKLALVAQDEMLQVRRGFIEKLQKYLVKEKLPHRFYTIMFLTTFEPEVDFRQSITTWIRSRAKFLDDTQKEAHVVESILPRLLSLLAHHPDYAPDIESLAYQAQYLIYYVSCVSSQKNCGLIYKYAERVKQAADAINPETSENIYVLSELAQAVVRKWEEKKGWSLQTWPPKVGIPTGLFGALQSREVAQHIATTQYLPDDVDKTLDGWVRDFEKKKKRKSIDDDSTGPAIKKLKADSRAKDSGGKKKSTKLAKTPKRRNTRSESVATSTIDSADRRKSGRSLSLKQSYADRDSSDDDKEMWDGADEWDYFDDDMNPIPAPEEQEESESGEGQESAEKSPQSVKKQGNAKPTSSGSEDEDISDRTPRKNGAVTISKAKRVMSGSKRMGKPTGSKVLSTTAKEKPASRRPTDSPIAKGKAQTAKSTVLSKPKGKGRVQAKKDIYDMDTSD